MKRFLSSQWIVLGSFLLGIILAVGYGVSLAGGQPVGPDSATLTELEQTKLQLAVEKQKNSAAQAQFIRQAYEKNQEEAQQLQKDANDLHDAICDAHSIPANLCEVSPDGQHLSRRPDPPKPKSPGHPEGKK